MNLKNIPLKGGVWEDKGDKEELILSSKILSSKIS
jgi:hypothetical protein